MWIRFSFGTLEYAVLDNTETYSPWDSWGGEQLEQSNVQQQP